MSTQYQSVKNDDYEPIYYSLVAYNKFQSLSKYWLSQNGFEANSIIDDLYLGSIDSVMDKTKLNELGVTHIISAIAGFIPPYPEKFKYLVVDALDSELSDLTECFDPCVEFIDNAVESNGKVLIHCMAGRSRSASIVCAYLVNKFGMDVDSAVKSMQSQRNIVQPNPSFMKQLKLYQEICRKK